MPGRLVSGAAVTIGQQWGFLEQGVGEGKAEGRKWEEAGMAAESTAEPYGLSGSWKANKGLQGSAPTK